MSIAGLTNAGIQRGMGPNHACGELPNNSGEYIGDR
jgi:hypothetical protein